METIQAFKFRLVPTPEQEDLLSRHAGCARFVWNKALALQKGRLDAGMPLLSYGDLAKLLTLWRASDAYGFLALGPAHPQQWALKFLDRAIWDGLTKKKGFPRFKKKGEGDALRFPDARQIKIDLTEKDPDGRNAFPRIFVPRVGWVRFRKSREIVGTLRNATVIGKAGRWSVSVQTERESPDPIARTAPEIALDLGVATFATTSSGVRIHPTPELVMAMKAAEKKRVREQRKLSRKYRKGPKSRNFAKQKLRVARVHEKVANMRLDFLHKASTAISETQAVVFVEDLRIRNMTRSARGTRGAPGRNVRQKAGLNRSILSRGWGTFLSLLEYKLSRRGGRLVRVPPQYTSQTCSSCGSVSPDNRKTQEAFVCVVCGHAENADVNAAKNILRAGHARSACLEESSSKFVA
ncbi:MAG: RNA-guided endonuclease InsQ/TnpB family protein [Leptospirales bacterium]